VVKAVDERLKYTGDKDKQPKPKEQDKLTGQLLYPYLPGEKLVEAVNLAIALERPLLLKGEPGCGKTKLAHAVAYELIYLLKLGTSNLPVERGMGCILTMELAGCEMHNLLLLG
jgi:Holliday junction resolvasome RuvABC ATP-dependent DNA helicase subunit